MNDILTYVCKSCPNDPQFKDKFAWLNHMAEVHKLKEPIKYSRQMVMHIDGRDFFISVYECKAGEVKFSYSQTSRRVGVR